MRLKCDFFTMLGMAAGCRPPPAASGGCCCHTNCPTPERGSAGARSERLNV